MQIVDFRRSLLGTSALLPLLHLAGIATLIGASSVMRKRPAMAKHIPIAL
jgi:hypothetical protein